MPWPLRMILRVAPFVAIAGLYVGWRVSRSLITLFAVTAWKVRLAVFLVVILLNLLPLVILTTYDRNPGETFFLSQTQLQTADFLFNFPYWIGLAIVIEAFFYILAIDIVATLFRIIPAIRPQNWQKWQSILTLCATGFFIIYVPLRVYFDTYHVRQDTMKIEIANLPPALENLRLGFISDVQVDRYTQQTKLSRLDAELAEVNADLLLFSGDLVTSGQRFIDQGVNFLGQTSAPLGQIACMGDHDHWANPHKIANGLKHQNWSFLQDQHQLINYEGHKILVTGITYIYSRRIPGHRLRQLMESAPDADLKIALVHQPSELVINTAKKYGYHIVLAGHTHGGQIVFRPFGFSLTATQFENRFYSGFYETDNLPVIVTNGVGLTLAPIRYQAPAEVTVIEFQNPAAE